MIQTIIVSTVVLLAVCYAIYRITDAVKKSNDPCSGCAGCVLHDQIIKKRKEGTKKPSCFNKKR